MLTSIIQAIEKYLPRSIANNIEARIWFLKMVTDTTSSPVKAVPANPLLYPKLHYTVQIMHLPVKDRPA